MCFVSLTIMHFQRVRGCSKIIWSHMQTDLSYSPGQGYQVLLKNPAAGHLFLAGHYFINIEYIPYIMHYIYNS